jgi:hypothetical protein
VDERESGWDERYCTRSYYDFKIAQAPEGAIIANLWAHSPHNSYTPPFWYADHWLECHDCGAEFKNSAEQQRYWYEELKIPIHVLFNRCPTCRRARRELRAKSQGKQSDAETGDLANPA